MNNPLYQGLDRHSVVNVETGLRGLSDDQKRLVGISTISVVTRLALEFRMEDVVSLLCWCCKELTRYLGDPLDRLNVASTLAVC